MVEISAKDRAADAAYELATSPRDELAGAESRAKRHLADWQSLIYGYR